jgi:benzoyl-CoA reductase/2-hydroxyglutaryl-CoA dehydratase subunit BcrC/BadD/HgdB
MAGRRVGLTTTIPVEVLLAAGVVPVDLNNLFITSPDPSEFVRQAELEGYPRTACAWIKGLYAVMRQTGIEEVVAVTQGDCSQTHAMMETLQGHGVRLIPFAFPYDRDPELLQREINRLREHFGVSWEAAEQVREELLPLRRKVACLDRLTWEENRVSGQENHFWQVSCSDFEGDPETFEQRLDTFLEQVRQRPPSTETLRLAYVGVPPIISDLYEFIESRDARVVYNEIQRQFTMAVTPAADLLEQYRRYTYPYDIFGRLEDITAEVARRRIDGVIHYVQAFCFRQIQDILLRSRLNCPVLTLEGDTPGALDSHSRLRLEAFLETLTAQQDQSRSPGADRV